MTADVRDRILGLLSAGPASVARLAAGLGVPGGVVSYELKLLERDGLVRVGTTRRDHGVPTPLYVSTAAAAPPALRLPTPIPGLTWFAGEPYPTPLWTVPEPPPSSADEPAPSPLPEGRPADAGTGENDRLTSIADVAGARGDDPTDPLPGTELPEPRLAETEEVDPGSAADFPDASYTGIRFPTRRKPADAGPAPARPRPSGPAPAQPGESAAQDPSRRAAETGTPAFSHPQPPRPRRFNPSESHRGPRLHDMRRVPMDDATFYEFAERLDALAREFAARATPGAPAAEVTILLTRPDGDATTGYGS